MALDKLLQWASIAYIVCVAIAAVATLAIYHLSARVNAAKDRELEKYRTESTIKITAAQAEAAEAMKIAESERLGRAELESQVAVADAALRRRMPSRRRHGLSSPSSSSPGP